MTTEKCGVELGGHLWRLFVIEIDSVFLLPFGVALGVHLVPFGARWRRFSAPRGPQNSEKCQQ